VVLACAFGAFFIVKTPLLWGFDETSHVARAFQVSEGHVLAKSLGDNRAAMGYGGYIPVHLQALIAYVDHDLLSSVGIAHVHDPKGYTTLGDESLSSPGVTYAFPNTAAYTPVAYVPSAAAIRVAEVLGLDLGNTIYLARAADLAFYVGCVGCALAALRRSRLRWALFVVALFPVSVFEASTITADTANNAVAFLLSALVIKAFFVDERLSKLEEVLLFLAALTLPLLKPSYLVLDLLVLLVPNSALTSRRAALALKAVALPIGFVAFAVWQDVTTKIVSEVSLMRPGPDWQLVDPHRQLRYLVDHPFSGLVTLVRTLRQHGRGYFQQMFGQLSFANVDIPAVSVLLSAASAVVAAIFVEPVQKLRLSRVYAIGAVVAVNVGLVFLVEYLSWSDVGDNVVRGVNGRYFVPLLVLVLSAVGTASPVRALVKRRSHENRIALLICLMVVVSLTLSCVRFDQVVWR
jgi:uncharacterized membrane protein